MKDKAVGIVLSGTGTDGPADVRKDVFLATLSHELRNPLAPIRMAAHLMQTRDLNAEQLDEARDIIARQVAHMGSLLDDLLDVSRITRGSFLLKKKRVELQQLLHEAVEASRSEIDSRNHTLRVEYPTGSLLLEVDPVRIVQVITNLLTNAAKYTPRGGLIHAGTRMEAQHLVIFVRDNGIGLSSESLGKVFDMFSRVDSRVARKEGGLGIGLALAKGLVGLHGGRMEVHSDGEGQGSEFLVLLPHSLVMTESDATGPEGSYAPAASRRILVADDNPDSAHILAMLLRLAGHRVFIAQGGAQALEMIQRERPEVAIIDVGMPEVSGYEVAERIRREPWGESTTLIAVSGWGQDADKRRAIAAGFNHHLTKPVSPRDLEQLLTKS
jgi:CheY-like chemotaxis protein